ncbi:MAG: helix-turn-helix domain-containing protein [Lentisphaeria bacterium]|nr:helix-turn-helix domain-containing protein [Lentisphaeria bacterium]
MKHYCISAYLRPPDAPPVWVEHVFRRTKPEPSHTHDCMELMYIRGGAACCRVNDRHYPVVRGDVYAFSPGDVHSFSISGPLSYDTLLFSMELFSPEERAELLGNPLFSCWCRPGSFREKKLSFPVAAAGGLDAAFDELAAECQRPGRCNGVLRRALLLRLLFIILGKGTPVGASSSRRDLQLSSLFNFITTHSCEKLSRARMAGAAGVSPGYLNEFMRRSIGQGAAEYVIRCRVEQARDLLEHTEKSVSEIAVSVGFYDTSHFIRAFRRHTGMTPGAYRKLVLRGSGK